MDGPQKERQRRAIVGVVGEDLSQDVDGLVRYLRGLGKEKIVLLGHSTGCQVGNQKAKRVLLLAKPLLLLRIICRRLWTLTLWLFWMEVELLRWVCRES